ncbi:MAG: ribbon-helix-helix domain-containing protein [Promethearchaeia archaeon]
MDRGLVMRLIAVHLPEQIVSDIEELVTNGFYPNRSEAIRNAIRDLLKRELWNGKVIADETKSEAVNQ